MKRIENVDSCLLWLLRRAGDEWGPTGVALVAAELAGGKYQPPTPEIWHLAVCRDCQPVCHMPFKVESQRDIWLTRHAAATGHHVEPYTELRNEPGDLVGVPEHIRIQPAQGGAG